MKHWSTNNVRPRLCFCQKGVTLIELLLALAVGSMLTLGLFGFMNSTLNAWQYGTARMDLLNQANFAMNRMVDAVSGTRRVLIPLPNNPDTTHDESIRPILAVTLPPNVNRNDDPFADADNDGDGLVDEDTPADNTNDDEPGIIGIDDDGDGQIDEGDTNDNDEDGTSVEDYLNGDDRDNDGAIDEDLPANNDWDGNVDDDNDNRLNEDWFDPQVFYISQDGKALIERLPNITPTPSPYPAPLPLNYYNNPGYTERPIAEAETVELTIQRLPKGEYDRGELIKIILKLESAKGGRVTLETSVRLGGT